MNPTDARADRGDRAVLSWSLISGGVPVVLLVAGCGGLGFLLSPRSGRRWWRAVLMSGTVAAVAVGATMVVVTVAAPFPDPVPAVVWWSAGAVLLAVSLAVVLLIRPGRGPRILGVVAALVVASAAASQVNVYFGQYPTFREALGLPAADQLDFARVTAVASGLVTRPPDRSLAEVWRPSPGMGRSGSVSEVRIPAPASGFAARPAWVYLPPAYLASPRAQLPVLVLLAGQPGSPRDWLVGGRLSVTMNRYAAAHDGLAPVVVVPDGLGSALANPMCLDSRLGRVQTYLSVDVPAWIRSTLQVDPSPASWAVGGSSAGGTCALQLALNAPRVYPTFVDLSGQSGPTLGDRARTIRAAFGGDAAAFAAVNPLDLLARNRYPGTAGFVVAGAGDSLYRPQADDVVRAARRAGLPVEYRQIPGGHDWRVVGTGLETALPWLATRLHLTQ